MQNKKRLKSWPLLLALIALVIFSFGQKFDKNDFGYTYFSGNDTDTLKYETSTPEALDELQKLIQHYDTNLLKIKGKVKVSASSDDEPATPSEEVFEIVMSKANYDMKYGQAETILNEKEMILVDHDEKVIFITSQPNASADYPISPAMFSLSTVKDQFQSVTVRMHGNLKLLSIIMDESHKSARYEVLYDPSNYTIKTIKLSIGYPISAVSDAGLDSLQQGKPADSLMLVTEDGEEFNTGHIITHEQLLVEIQYLEERKLEHYDFDAGKFLEKKKGKSKLSPAYNGYRLINSTNS